MANVADILTDNLDIWTSAIERRSTAGRGRSKKFSLYGVEKLRALILDLAVRGKLVPQHDDDQPALELLNGRGLRERRAATPITSPGKKSAERTEAWPFSIPRSWAWTHLGVVTNYGETEKADPGDVAPEMWVLELEDIERGSSRLIERVRYIDRQFQSQKNRFQAGDVIYGKLRPYLDKVVIADEQGVCTTEMVPVRAFPGLSPGYLRVFLKSPFFIDLATNSTHGMNLPRLGTEKARAAPFSLPPIAEQRRIIAKVDELMALCDRLEAQTYDAIEAHELLVGNLLITLTKSQNAEALAENWARIETHFDTLFTTEASIDQLKQTILQLAVMGKLVPQDPNDEPAMVLVRRLNSSRAHLVQNGEAKRTKTLPPITQTETPFAIPQIWQWVRFGDVINPAFAISYGVLVPGENEDGGVPFVRIADLSISSPPDRPEKSISAEIDAQYERTRLVGGEILMGVVGSIGKLGIAPQSWRGANIARAICRIVPSEFVSKEYIILLLQSDFMQDNFRGDTRTLAQPTLNINLIRSSLTPLPPIEEQKRIAKKVSELWTVCDSLVELLRAGDRQSVLLADIFTSKAKA